MFSWIALSSLLLFGLYACRTLDVEDVMYEAKLELRLPDGVEGEFNLEVLFTNINTREIIRQSNVRRLDVRQKLLKGVYRIQVEGNLVPEGHPDGALPLVVRGNLDAVTLTEGQEVVIISLIRLRQ